MIPLIFRRKKTAEFLRQNSGDLEEKKRQRQKAQRPRTLEDNAYGDFCSHTRSFDGDSVSSGQGGAYAHRHGGGCDEGCDRGYLGTGSYNYYDHNCANKDQQPRRSPSPVGSGEWALRECELHTTWLNEVRKCHGQPPVTDLRTAVADGITLVQLTQALTNHEVSCVEPNTHLSKPQALANLDRCLAYLAASDVDVIGVQANDLVEGDFKSILLLLTQIRRRYDPTLSRRIQGDGEQSSGGSVIERVTGISSCRSPDMPGPIDTLPQAPRVSPKTEKAGPQMRRSAAVDDDHIIPGMMASEEYGGHVSGHIVHNDSDRRPLTNINKPSSAPRPHVSLAATPERPPSQLGVAWAADSTPKARQTPEVAEKSGRTTVSVEERLRQLLQEPQPPFRPVEHDNGEPLLLPRGSPDFENGVSLGGVNVNHSHTDTTRLFGQIGDLPQASCDQGYKPSKPADRRPGPRVEAMLPRNSANQQQEIHSRHNHPSFGGHFSNKYPNYPGSQPSPSQSGSQISLGSAQKASVLRSTWNKLYGVVSELQPKHDVLASNMAINQGNGRHDEFKVESQDVTLHSFGSDLHKRLPQQITHFPLDPGDSTPFPRHPRESPMGQSNSTQGQTSDSSNPSSQSGHTVQTNFRGDVRHVKEVEEEDEEELRTLGPASKYPENTDSRPSSARLTPKSDKNFDLRDKHFGRPSVLSRGDVSNSPLASPREHGSSQSNKNNSRDLNDGKSGLSGSRGSLESRSLGGAKVNPAFEAEDFGDVLGSLVHGSDCMNATAAVFHYHKPTPFSESSSNRSVTPPLPPLSPSSSSQQESASSSPAGALSRPHSAPGQSNKPGMPVSRTPGQSNTNRPGMPVSRTTGQGNRPGMPVPRTPDLLVTSALSQLKDSRVDEAKGMREGRSKHPGNVLRAGPTTQVSSLSSKDHKESFPLSNRYFARSHSLDDVRESGNDSNDLSFDVENTMLIIPPSDISEMGEGSHLKVSQPFKPSRESLAVQGQLERLESMYHNVVKLVGADRPHSGKGSRRWSIASSDTSSLRRGRPIGAHSSSARAGKDFRSIQRRFQRIESHVVTLARSLAHLSSELRAHNALRRDLDAVKRELRELRQQGAVTLDTASPPLPYFEKFRGWIPSLTNPKRINKLTQFFGQEPPLLEIFLKKLGYERFAKNFAVEHIGMIELPYMTEERLESIGIPMGPRLRILQESQLCFRQENFDIYIV